MSENLAPLAPFKMPLRGSDMALFLEPKGSTSLRVFGLNNAKGAICLTGLCWHPSSGAGEREPMMG